MTNCLREYRKQNHLSQEALAEKLGVSRMTIIRWENGRRQIDPDSVPNIAEKLQISPRRLRPDLAEMFGA